MFQQESVEFCPECAELTAHSRRRFPVAPVLGVLLLFGAGWLAWTRTAWLLMAVLLPVGVALIAWDRERCLHVACERCRGRRRHLVRRSKPTLDGNTEINI